MTATIPDTGSSQNRHTQVVGVGHSFPRYLTGTIYPAPALCTRPHRDTYCCMSTSALFVVAVSRRFRFSCFWKGGCRRCFKPAWKQDGDDCKCSAENVQNETRETSRVTPSPPPPPLNISLNTKNVGYCVDGRCLSLDKSGNGTFLHPLSSQALVEAFGA